MTNTLIRSVLFVQAVNFHLEVEIIWKSPKRSSVRFLTQTENKWKNEH